MSVPSGRVAGSHSMTPSSPQSSTVASTASAVGEHRAPVAARPRRIDRSFILVGLKVEDAVLMMVVCVAEGCGRIQAA